MNEGRLRGKGSAEGQSPSAGGLGVSPSTGSRSSPEPPPADHSAPARPGDAAPPTGPPRLFVLVGIPGCGKTTYARRYLLGALRVSFDDLRLMLTGVAFDPAHEEYVMSAGHAALAALLARAQRWRRDVVLDATNVTRDRRRFYLALAERCGVPVVAVYLPCPLDVALARNRQRGPAVPDEVVRRFHAALEPPTLEEGFAEVREVQGFSI